MTSFFGKENYPRLSEIKKKYDPEDLFIVRKGVGSERWDDDALCPVSTRLESNEGSQTVLGVMVDEL